MPWFRGDDKSHFNKKLLRVGLLGTGLYFRAVSWCASELTDGEVPEAVIPSLSPELSAKGRQDLVAAMVEAGLWHDRGGAYEINDYLAYNPSRAQVEGKRKSERSRLAGKRSWR